MRLAKVSLLKFPQPAADQLITSMCLVRLPISNYSQLKRLGFHSLLAHLYYAAMLALASYCEVFKESGKRVQSLWLRTYTQHDISSSWLPLIRSVLFKTPFAIAAQRKVLADESESNRNSWRLHEDGTTHVDEGKRSRAKKRRASGPRRL